VGGVLNTALTYAIYLVLSHFIDYQIAFAVGYAAGISFSYFFNARMVFGAAASIKTAATYPLVYLVQYIASAAALAVLVGAFQVSKALAPICVTVVMIPLTYLMSKAVLGMDQGGGDASALQTADDWHHNRFLRLALLPLLVVAAIWLPFGFAMSGLIEEWGFLGSFIMHGTYFVASVNSPLPAHALRPLTVLPQAIAYATGPDSFLSWHLLLMASLLVKGLAMGLMTLRATRRMTLAVFVSALVLLYPADTMQLSFRSIHIDWGIALELAASSLFVEAMLARRRAVSLALAVGAAAVVLSSICMYEAALPLVVFPFVLVAVRTPLREVLADLRRQWHVSALWVIAIVIYLVYAVLTSPHIASYQQSVLNGKHLIPTLIEALPKLFSVGLLRAMLGGWYDAVAMVFVAFSNVTYLLIATSCIVAALWLVAAPARDRAATDSRIDRPVRIILAGMALACAGYAPFLISASHLAITQRTYLFASPGATLAWAGLLLALNADRARWRRWLATSLACLMLCFGLGSQLVQMHHYDEISVTQRHLLKSMTEALGPRPVTRQMLILDGTDQLGQTWMFLPGVTDTALAYLYGRYLGPAEICRMPEGAWETVDSIGRPGTCVRDSDGWTLTPAPSVDPAAGARAPSRHFADADTTVIAIDDQGKAVPLQALQDAALDSSTIARRVGQLGAQNPWTLHMFRDQVTGPVVKADFGRWWSLEKVIRGTGWRDPEWDVGYFHHHSRVWKVSERATLAFDIDPAPGPYRLRAKFGVFAGDEVRPHVAISVNGVPIGITMDDQYSFEGIVPAGVLHKGRNVWAIDAPTVPTYYGLSATLDRYEFKPAR
jgi:putative flippase GtrA